MIATQENITVDQHNSKWSYALVSLLCVCFLLSTGVGVLLFQKNRALSSEVEHLEKSQAAIRHELQQTALNMTKIQAHLNHQVKKIFSSTGLYKHALVNRSLSRKPSPDSRVAYNLAKIKPSSEVLQPSLPENNTSSSLDYITQTLALKTKDLSQLIEEKNQLLTHIPTLMPVAGWLTSSFGMRVSPFTGQWSMHNGVDIAAPYGSHIMAPADGTVTHAGYGSGYGRFVEIDHGNSIITRYGHTSRVLVKVGDRVQRGQAIAAVGSTGRSTGPHLHYEVLLDQEPVDPQRFFIQTPFQETDLNAWVQLPFYPSPFSEADATSQTRMGGNE